MSEIEKELKFIETATPLNLMTKKAKETKAIIEMLKRTIEELEYMKESQEFTEAYEGKKARNEKGI